MKALILSAGFGTRLLPYTREIPKPLFTIMSKPVLEHVIKKLLDNGFNGDCFAEIDASREPIRLMNYYRALFLAYQNIV